MLGVIYKWTNIINNKSYIGATIQPEKRYKAHLIASNNPVYPFHKALNEFGLESFKYEEIENIDESLLDEREKYWISYYDSYKNGYNNSSGGEGHAHSKHSEETKKKIGISHHKYWNSLSEDEKNERIKKIKPVHLFGEKNGMYEKHHSEESRKKMSETKKKNYIKRIWIHNNESEKLINISDVEKYISNNWIKGRK